MAPAHKSGLLVGALAREFRRTHRTDVFTAIVELKTRLVAFAVLSIGRLTAQPRTGRCGFGTQPLSIAHVTARTLATAPATSVGSTVFVGALGHTFTQACTVAQCAGKTGATRVAAQILAAFHVPTVG